MIAPATDTDGFRNDDPAPAPARAPRRRLPLSIVLASAVVAALLSGMALLAVYLLWFRPTLDPAFDPGQLAEAQQKWAQTGPASYDLDLSLSVNENAPESIHVEVRNGQPTRVVRAGRVLERRDQMDPWTVEGLFETMRRDRELAAGGHGGFQAPEGAEVTMRVAYDPKFGYPVRYLRYVDQSVNQIRWNVERLIVVSP